MKTLFKIFICFCVSLLISCKNNELFEPSIKNENVNNELIQNDLILYIKELNARQDLKITFSKNTSLVFKVYMFNLESKQWEIILLTKEGLSWDENSYLMLFNPIKSDDRLCLEMKYQQGDVERYGYANHIYDDVILNETNFTWLFNENISIDNNTEIPFAFGIFEENEIQNFDVSLMKDIDNI